MVIPTTEFDFERYNSTANLVVAILSEGKKKKEELVDLVKGTIDVTKGEIELVMLYLKEEGLINYNGKVELTSQGYFEVGGEYNLNINH
ncbi:MAG: hypothetical protein J7K22_04490 [Nanoarchaeota archaeon]|nr:hypothetical protein [Nanoarchaeota archaeon]